MVTAVDSIALLVCRAYERNNGLSHKFGTVLNNSTVVVHMVRCTGSLNLTEEKLSDSCGCTRYCQVSAPIVA